MEIIFIISYAIGIGTLFFRNNYLRVCASIILIGTLWLIMTGSLNRPDLANYEPMYYEVSSYTPLELLFQWDGRDIGYALIECLFNYVGLDFYEFLIVIETLSLIIIIKITKYITEDILLVLMFYILWPFFIDVIQIRTFLVHIMAFGAIYIYSKETKKSFVIAILIIMLAGTIHSLAFCYIPFFIFQKIYKNKGILLMTWGISLLMPIYINFIIGPMSAAINSFFYLNASDNMEFFSRYTVYFNDYVKYAYWLFINAGILLMYWIKKAGEKYWVEDKITERSKNYFEICYAFCLYVGLFMPFYALSGAEVGRIPRCFSLSFITSVVLFLKTTNNNRTKIIVGVITTGILFLAGLTAFYYTVGVEDVTQMLNYNVYFDF